MEKTIGQRIKECRKNKGMTQEQLAEALLTKKSTISYYENDRIDIKCSVVMELARVLGCTAGYLIDGEKMPGIDEQIMLTLSKIQDDKVKEIALKQIEVLTALI